MAVTPETFTFIISVHRGEGAQPKAKQKERKKLSCFLFQTIAEINARNVKIQHLSCKLMLHHISFIHLVSGLSYHNLSYTQPLRIYVLNIKRKGSKGILDSCVCVQFTGNASVVYIPLGLGV